MDQLVEHIYIDRFYTEKFKCCACGRAITGTTSFAVPTIFIENNKKYLTKWGDSERCCFDCWALIPNTVKEALKVQGKFQMLESKRQKYLERLSGNFKESDVVTRFNHYLRDRNKFPFSVIHDTCAICENEIRERNVVSMDKSIAKVPVTNTDTLSGGNVEICRFCNAKKKKQVYTEESRNLKTNCSRCNEVYLITSDEKHYRESLIITPDFLCPECTIIELDDTIKKEDVDSYFSPPNRFLPYNCSCCGGPTNIDRTVATLWLETKLLMSTSQKKRCMLCAVLAAGPNEKVTYLGDNFYLLLYNYPEGEAGEPYAYVYKLEDNKPLEVGTVLPQEASNFVKEVFKIKEEYARTFT